MVANPRMSTSSSNNNNNNNNAGMITAGDPSSEFSIEKMLGEGSFGQVFRARHLGLVKEFGFYTIDRRQGNTGGLGGAFGYFYGVGKPLPIRECQPYKPSFRFRVLSLIGKMGKKFSKSMK